MAVIWVTSWLERLGAVTISPDTAVTVVSELSGIVARVGVDASATFTEGRVLHCRVELDGGLAARTYRFDLVCGNDRQWGWHGHSEPVLGLEHVEQPAQPLALGVGRAYFDLDRGLLRHIISYPSETAPIERWTAWTCQCQYRSRPSGRSPACSLRRLRRTRADLAARAV
jgi:hypothetical protein